MTIKIILSIDYILIISIWKYLNSLVKITNNNSFLDLLYVFL